MSREDALLRAVAILSKAGRVRLQDPETRALLRAARELQVQPATVTP